MRTKNILLFAEPSRVYDRHFLRGIARYASEQAHWNFYGDILIHRKEIPPIVKKLPFAGIITCHSSPEHMEFLDRLNLPTIIYRAQNPSPVDNRVLVLTDHQKIGKTAAQYYKRLGYKHFAYLGSPSSYWSKDRLAGFQEELQDNPVFIFKHPDTTREYDWNKGAELTRKWLKGLPKPIALFAGSDEWGRFALNLCMEEDIPVPFQVSVLGANDDSLICDFCYKPLSSIRLDVGHAGYRAAEQLHHLISNKPAKESPLFVSPLQIVERQSTGHFSSEDPHVTRAIEFIRENFTNNIHVDEITKIAALSRRSLETRFKNCTGETVAGALRRIRAEHACKLLLESDMAIYEIAQELGYDDEKHFSRYFRKQIGTPPSIYRQRRD